jgi:hypothetical protein
MRGKDYYERKTKDIEVYIEMRISISQHQGQVSILYGEHPIHICKRSQHSLIQRGIERVMGG